MVSKVSLALGLLAGLNLTSGLGLLYARMLGPVPLTFAGDQFLVAILLFHSIVLAFLANEIYNLRPWAYWAMRAIIIAVMAPPGALWRRHEETDSDEVRLAFGIGPESQE